MSESRKTLDQYTPDERQRMIGRWADTPDGLFIIGRAITDRNEVYCLDEPGTTGRIDIPQNITPRLDLPPAWTPDGKPVPVHAEYEVMAPAQFGVQPAYFSDKGQADQERRKQQVNAHLNGRPDPNKTMRVRFTTEWEAASDE